MNRRVAGALLMVVALVGGLMLSVVARVGSPGTAFRSPLPAPPAAGSCVLRSTAGVRVVDCDRPHSAEVASSWKADSVTSASRDPYQICQDATASYLGHAAGGDIPALVSDRWGTPPVPFVVELVNGPNRQLVTGWSWQACLVQPIVPRIYQTGYTGRLVDLSDSASPPFNLRRCYLQNSSIRSGTACGTVHIGEILASQQFRIEGEQGGRQDGGPARTSQCAAIATSATGAADPTFGGRLSVVVHLDEIGGGGQSIPAGNGSSGHISHFTVYVADCSLEVHGQQQLYSSLVGIGDGPLPLR